jgi:hypothetical protein
VASILGNRAAAQLAMREGVNASQALKAFRAAGGSVRTQTWYRLYGQAQLEGALTSREAGAPLNRVPTASEVQPASVPRARGFMQRVTVYGRTEEGHIITRDVSLRSGKLVSRGNAINKALALVQAGMDDPERRDRYPMVALLMGTYSATYEFNPEE